jgi:hypothetical protein
VKEPKEPLPVRVVVGAAFACLWAIVIVGGTLLWVVGMIDPETRKAMGGKS